MNVSLIILYIILLSLLIIFIVYNILAISRYRNKFYESFETSNQACTPDLASLPDAGNLCCMLGNSVTSNRYIHDLNMVVSPFPEPYEKICEGYCKKGMETKGICLDGLGQEDYDECINLTKPVNCNSLSKPVAVSGTTYYYINSSGNGGCERTSIC